MAPQNLKFTKEHEWVRIEGDTAVTGITEYATQQLGDIVYVELPDAGKLLEQMKTFGVVESVKAVSDLYAPLSGEVMEANSLLNDHPETVNKDPYGEGWMIKVKINPASDLSKLMSLEDYEKLLESL